MTQAPVAPAHVSPPRAEAPSELGIGGPRQVAEYWLTPERFLLRCASAPDRVILRFPGVGPVYALSHPQDLKRLHTMPPGGAELSEAVSKFAPHKVLFGETTLVALEGADHVRLRRLMTPPVHGDALRSYEPVMIARTRQALDEWPWGEPAPTRTLMAPVALDIVMSAVFGVSDPDRLARCRAASIRFITAAGTPRFLFDTAVAMSRGGKWKGTYRYVLDRRAAVEAIVQEEMTERRTKGDLERTDVLGLFMAARYDDDQPMSDQSILENLVGLLAAGYETTATTLGWLAVMLSRNPEVLAALEGAVASGDDEYVDAVTKEILRLRTPGLFSVRHLTQPLQLEGTVIPANSVVASMIGVMHRRADIWPDPERFEPRRFLDTEVPDHSWLPFGGGARRCLGAAFTMVEVRMIMKTLIEHARIRPTTQPVEPTKRNNIVLIPGKQGLMTLDRR